jgi:hypothetical protein
MYEIAEVFTTSTGKVYPSKLSLTRLESLPNDLFWFAVKEWFHFFYSIQMPEITLQALFFTECYIRVTL